MRCSSWVYVVYRLGYHTDLVLHMFHFHPHVLNCKLSIKQPEISVLIITPLKLCCVQDHFIAAVSMDKPFKTKYKSINYGAESGRIFHDIRQIWWQIISIPWNNIPISYRDFQLLRILPLRRRVNLARGSKLHWRASSDSEGGVAMAGRDLTWPGRAHGGVRFKNGPGGQVN